LVRKETEKPDQKTEFLKTREERGEIVNERGNGANPEGKT